MENEFRRVVDAIPGFLVNVGETVRPCMLEQGAVECLFKPFSETALLGALNAALQVS